MKMYIGLNVHSKFSVYVTQNGRGKTIHSDRIATNPKGLAHMIHCLHAPEGTPVAMETGPMATWVSRQLVAQKMKPVVIDAREVRVKALRPHQKSDLRDARELCEGLRRGVYQSIVYIPDESIEPLRLLISPRRHFVGIFTRQINAAKHLLRLRGQGGRVKALTHEKAWRSLLEDPKIADRRTMLEMHFDLWHQAQSAKRKIEAELLQAARPHQQVIDLLRTVPGVGPITAITFIATLGDRRRFPNSGHVVSYAGLAVSTYDSGERQRHGHITKRGSAEPRAMLCEAAQHAWRSTNPMNPYYRRVAAKKGHKQAIIAVAQRLAPILWRMWLNQEPLNIEKLNIARVDRRQTRVVHYELRNRPVVAAHC